MKEHIGFIGLGSMGEPMATNLVKAGCKLTVWNRSIEKSENLAKYGASVARDSDEVFSSCSIILMMLANDRVIDTILHRPSERFKRLVKNKVIVHMGTTLPNYSADLARDIKNAAGHYLEAPVSGSRLPAEQGKLVAMIAGEKSLRIKLTSLLAPITASIVECGAVPKAMQTKLAVNTYLIGLVTSLTEAVNFAKHAGIDMDIFKQVLCSGPMANDVMRVKLAKLLTKDYHTQASISDVLYNNQLITKSARLMGAITPLADTSELLYKQVAMNGYGSDDMIAVVEAFNKQ
ncbi:NAD(P)-dependent oxidoreductase [Exilibacterium tricleocarpae]|uniref:NAD(P)-dependent oxidoreductase n=1 Tax=Exilibacterium tricleocarpae TaxID=2591008 RepID=UPI001C5537B1|nr:NAD(P)-dependent oxidoreductase [Exilibacterium tricleocarpae]